MTFAHRDRLKTIAEKKTQVLSGLIQNKYLKN